MGEKTLPVLQAAYIQPYSAGVTHREAAQRLGEGQ
jgi:hypothetical protein